ncbi:uncharacterized [Tachysurus ichikawai]
MGHADLLGSPSLEFFWISCSCTQEVFFYSSRQDSKRARDRILFRLAVLIFELFTLHSSREFTFQSKGGKEEAAGVRVEQVYRPSSGEEQDVEARGANKQLGQRNRLKASGCSWKNVWG